MNNDKLMYTFLNACREGNLEFVRYLLTSFETKPYIDINSFHPSYYFNGLMEAFFENKFNIITYLLTSDDLVETANPFLVNEKGLSFFQLCVQENNYHMISFILNKVKTDINQINYQNLLLLKNKPQYSDASNYALNLIHMKKYL